MRGVVAIDVSLETSASFLTVMGETARGGPSAETAGESATERPCKPAAGGIAGWCRKCRLPGDDIREDVGGPESSADLGRGQERTLSPKLTATSGDALGGDKAQSKGN